VLPLLLLAPLAALLLLNLPWKGVPRSVFAAFGLALAGAQLLVAIAGPEWLGAPYGAPWDALEFGLSLDALGRVLLLTIGMVVCVAILVGHFTLRHGYQHRSFINLMLVSLIGMNGTVLLTDLFSLYVFVEITSVASFVLIALERGKDASEGAFKYLLLSAVAAVMMLGAVALFVLYAHGTSFAVVKQALGQDSQYKVVAGIATALYLSGLLIKAGVVPFHGWLPAAYSTAPAGVSVFLAGIATKAGGVYALIRLCHYVFSPTEPLGKLLLVVGTISIFVGALAALGQRDLKRMLAYSSISQVGYIVLALGCGTPLALGGAVFHLFNHAVFKSLLFSNAAAVEAQLGTTDMTRMGGLGKQMPVTGMTSLVALLSTAGIPPLAGFWSKFLIVVALWSAGHQVYALLAVLGSLLTLGYFLVMERTAFFGRPLPETEHVSEAGTGLLLPAVLLTLVTVGIGVFFPLLLDSFLLLGRGLPW
jgi:proton-translocating NADH-quinone oxidoreductase chain N